MQGLGAATSRTQPGVGHGHELGATGLGPEVGAARSRARPRAEHGEVCLDAARWAWIWARPGRGRGKVSMAREERLYLGAARCAVRSAWTCRSTVDLKFEMLWPPGRRWG